MSPNNLNELIEPKLGSPSAAGKVEKGKTDTESSAKRIRQAVYDIRYRARREGIKLDQAFNQYMAHTQMSGSERAAVKEKLGLTAGSSVSEQYFDEETAEHKKFKVRVKDKQSGKSYVRYATRDKIAQLRKNPNISSVEMTGYGEPYEGEKAKGERTAAVKSGKDWDGDGKVETSSKEHAGVVHNAIQRAKGGIPDGQDTRKKVRKEEFSSWRTDLIEIVNDIEASKKISEKKVKNKVVINPEIKETFESLGGEVIEMSEINENFLVETIDIATEYFYNEGLNEEGLDIVIEDLGLEKFVDYVFYISEDSNLNEARVGGVKVEPVTKSGKAIGSLKGGAKTSAIKSRQKAKAARREAESSASASKPSGMTAALKSQSSVAKKITTDKGKKAVEKAKESQSSKKPVRDRIARGVLGAVKAYQAGMERHRAATQTAGKALKVAAKGASEFGKGVASGVKATGKAAQAVHKVLKNSYELGEALHPSLQKLDAQSAQKMKEKSAAAQKEKEETKTSTAEFQAHKKTILAKGGTPVQALDTWQKLKMARDKKNEVKEEKKMKGEDPCWKGYQMVGTKKKGGKEVPNCVPKEEYELSEKALSVSQQQAAGAALAAKRGEIAASELKGASVEMYKSMSEKQLRDFAKTKHKGLPEKKEVAEAIKQISGRETTPPQETTAQQDDIQKKQMLANKQKMIQKQRQLQQQQFNLQKQGKLPMGHAMEEVEIIDERTAFAKKTGMSATRKGQTSIKGGAKGDKAYIHVKKMIRGMEGTPEGQRKKVPGQKLPTAGKYGSERPSPEQIVKKRRAQRQAAQDSMSSRFD